MRAWTAVVAVVAATSGASASTALALPGDFWGVAPQAAPTAEQFQRLKRGGVDSIRIPIIWPAVEPTRGAPFTWSAVDNLVAGAASAEIEILPFLSGAPDWAVRSVWVPGSHRTVKAPERLPVSGAGRAGWVNFAQEAVARYGPNGSFWVENPSVPARPIRTWQIWNEANFKYFVVRPNPAQFGRLVKISHAAIKGVDPGAKIVLSGLFAWPREGDWKKQRPRQAYYATEFLDLLYKQTPGIKSKFDGIALHPYTRSYKKLEPQVKELRGIMKENRDAGAGLWITELGWSSQPPIGRDSFAKGPAGQAAQLKGAFSLLRRYQRRWNIKRVYWFSVDDQVGACNFCDGSGLFGPGFVPKRSWYAFVRFAGGTAG